MLNSKDYPNLRIGDVVEIYHPEHENRLVPSKIVAAQFDTYILSLHTFNFTLTFSFFVKRTCEQLHRLDSLGYINKNYYYYMSHFDSLEFGAFHFSCLI